MPAKITSPPIFAPLQIGGRLHPEWALYFEQIPKIAETQVDASTVSDPPTQAEVNAIVTVVNTLIDKLQAADLME